MPTSDERLTASADNLVMLIYTSLARNEMSKDDLLEILHTSRENNEPLNISGMLLYKDGNFLQVLEGPDRVVSELYEVIRYDPRHYQVTMVIKRPISKRDFSQWKMGFTNLSDEDAQQIAGFSPFLLEVMASPSFIEHNSVALVFLEAFRHVMR